MNADLLRRYRWHRKHGYPGGGNALRAARAEVAALEAGLRVEWDFDIDGDLGDHEYWCAAAKARRCKGGNHAIEWARVVDPANQAHSLASLSNIIDADRNYRRVVEAELFEEALEELGKRYSSNPPITFADVGAAES